MDLEMIEEVHSIIISSNILKAAEISHSYSYDSKSSCYVNFQSENQVSDGTIELNEVELVANQIYDTIDFDSLYQDFFDNLPYGQYFNFYIVIEKLKKPKWYKE
ncbi:hypothetical protein [Persicobacter sp. CCB-QB2]|uniref:hypothetical protein n=1 Tax=Persicobacter sp. CCB-QB2 TaxID=1561025 RepID=UPI0006A9E0BC|nr:hypothetical protein [Persicobacter sp. CCB-QB2]